MRTRGITKGDRGARRSSQMISSSVVSPGHIRGERPMGTKPYRRQVRWGGSFDVWAATYDHAPELRVRPNPTEASVVEHRREASSTIARGK